MNSLFKNLSYLVVVALLVVIIFPASTAEGQNFAIYAYHTTPITDWDPAIEFSNGIVTMHNIYETLLRYDPLEESFEKILATDYERSEDGLTWHFDIREEVKFHDGTPLNAEAVKFSFERTKEMGQGAAFIWEPVEKIKVVDEYRLKFELNRPAPLDIIVASSYGAYIYSPTVLEENPDFFTDPNACGTGPYKLDSYVDGEEAIMSQFDDYWGGWEDNQFERVVIKRVTEPSTRRQMIEAGTADINVNLPHQDIEPLKANPQVEVEINPSLENTLLFFNTSREPLDNIKVRKALSYAFPYNDVIDSSVGGYAVQSRGAVPHALWGHGENLYQYEYNLDKAEELLVEAGYEEGFDLLLTYLSGDEPDTQMAEIYRAELDKIGINLNIRGMTWESQWALSRSDDLEERQDILIMNWWPDLASPYSFLANMFHSEEEPLFNLAYWSNEEFDHLINEARLESGIDLQKGEELFIEAQEILVDEAPAIFAYDGDYVRFLNPTFKGYKDNPAYPGVVFFYDTYRGQ